MENENEKNEIVESNRKKALQGLFQYDGNNWSALKNKGTDAAFFDPLTSFVNTYNGLTTISPYQCRKIHARVLRAVSEKAWVMNLCISNLIRKVRPFLKKATAENLRGFRIRSVRSVEEADEMTDEEAAQAADLAKFFEHTGDVEDDARTDGLDDYCCKILRDLLQIDQVACEIQRTQGGDVCAFWAVDAETIEIATPKCREETGVAFVQVINGLANAAFTKDEFIFDCSNPRTDIRRNGYGLSIVEMAIDLLTAEIQNFVYNAGFFTENHLPRGFLTLQGDPDDEVVEQIEDKLIDVMSGNAQSLWRIPVMPSGDNGKALEWIDMRGASNKDMEFSQWFDFLLSGIVGMFGFSMEDLGLHSSKSQTMFAANTAPKIESSKSLVLGDTLSFLQKHLNKILQKKNPDYMLEFVGYERDDPKETLDIDKGEVESYKSMNEKRAEKGLDALDFREIENPADIPMNPHAISAWQAARQDAQGGAADGNAGGFDFGGGDNDDGEGDAADDENGVMGKAIDGVMKIVV